MSKSDNKDSEPAPRKRATRFVPMDDVPRPGLSPRTREVVALALCGFALYGMLCLATFRYAELDGPVPTDGMSNLGGAFGYALAHGFTRALGLAGWIPFVMLLLGAVWMFLGRTLERLTIKALGAVVFAAMMAILFAGGDGLAGITRSTPYGAGGIFGGLVSPKLEGTFGGTGRLLLVSFGALMALLIATEWLLSQLFLRLALVVDLGWKRLWRRPAAAAAGIGATDFDAEPVVARRRRRAAPTATDDDAADEDGGNERRRKARAPAAEDGDAEAGAGAAGAETEAEPAGRRRSRRKAEDADTETDADTASDTEAKATAAENRVRFGQTKSEQTRVEAEREKAARDLDGSKRDT